MRILLAHNSLYYPSTGGGDKSNRLLMEALAERGHQVRVVTRVERFGGSDEAKLIGDLQERGITPTCINDGVVRFERNGVDVRTVASNPNIRAYFQSQIEAFDPDVIITSTDDPGQLLFDLAVRAERARVVYLVRATIAVPFGPDSSAVNATKTANLRRADAVVGVSHYVANYCREHGGLDAIHVPISLLDPVTEYPDLGSFDNPYVSMVNPCAVKGITIFVELADRFPHVPFAAVPTWGATAEDMAELRRRENIAVLPPFDDIDGLLRQTKVMLVPSVWAEARSRIVLESMSRGVPVIAADVGGLHEAMLGADYLVPVNPIMHYKAAVDQNMVPIADVPPQNIEPWVAVLDKLVTDGEHWQTIASRARELALEYARNLNAGPFESYLQEIIGRPKRTAPPRESAPALSEEKRRLLALRLKQKAGAAVPARKAAGSDWFSAAEEGAAEMLICLPYAGGGTALYKSWREPLRDVVQVTAVRLPGRESRLSEVPVEDLGQLVETLGPLVVERVAGRSFALFGHSMGAIIAFELARWLRRNSHPLPRTLHVSSARAPQFRLGHVPPPDPDDAALIEELRRLGGMPLEVLDNPDLMRVALPALRSDTRMYRRYVYTPEAPLELPIFAYAGRGDANIQDDHVEAWRKQTSGPFRAGWFEGGHFYLQTAPQGFLEALKQDMAS